MGLYVSENQCQTAVMSQAIAAIALAAMVALVVYVNVSNRRRRAGLSDEQKKQEDRELDDFMARW